MDRQLENKIPIEEFVNLPDSIALNIRYDESLRRFADEREYVYIGKIVHGNQAIVYVKENKIEEVLRELGVNNISYLPVVLGLLGTESIKAAGILDVQKEPTLALKGDGVLIGIIDTGVDYTKDAFINKDGKSRIQYIWDQTQTGNIPEGYLFGAEYTNEEINEAIKQENPYNIVKQKDDVGHGTFLASIAASNDPNEYLGAAPNSELIVVKLKKAKQYFINRYLIPPEQNSVFESINVMLGIEYMIEKAAQLNKPLAICIGLGTNQDGHDGFNALEEYLSTISKISGICVCAGAGNESNTAHHTDGRLEGQGDNKNIEIRVPENSYSFPIYIWNNFSDRISVSIKSPTGEIIGRVPAKAGTLLESNLVLERSKVSVRYSFPMPGSGSQLTTIKIIEPTPGIWTITIYGDIVLDGSYHAWLHMRELISPGIEFLTPTSNCTIVVPATSYGTITCGAYNFRNNSLYIDSSWGPTRTPVMSPDFAAPGVDSLGIFPKNNGTMTGTSVAAAVTTGACALMLQWGIVQKHNISLDTYRIKAYLIRGCDRTPGVEYPNIQWGYGRLDLYKVFTQLGLT